MKTKIKTISPDQNIIEHESGLKTVFVAKGKCPDCIYSINEAYFCEKVPCIRLLRNDEKIGHFIKLIEQ